MLGRVYRSIVFLIFGGTTLFFANCQPKEIVTFFEPKNSTTSSALTKTSNDENGYYYKVYEFSEKAVKGSTGNGSEIRVSSSDFIPHIKLSYGDKLVNEASGEQDYISTPTRWVAELVIIMPSFGTHRLIVTTKGKEITGHFTLEYDPLSGLTID